MFHRVQLPLFFWCYCLILLFEDMLYGFFCLVKVLESLPFSRLLVGVDNLVVYRMFIFLVPQLFILWILIFRVNGILIDLVGGWERIQQRAKIRGFWRICMFISLLLVNLIRGGNCFYTCFYHSFVSK